MAHEDDKRDQSRQVSEEFEDTLTRYAKSRQEAHALAERDLQKELNKPENSHWKMLVERSKNL